MAKKNFGTYLKGELVRVKKYFYVLRPVLACKHIANTNLFAPVEFYKLLDTLVKDKEVRSEIDLLIERKQSGEELDKEPRNDLLNTYLESEISNLESYLKQYDLQQYTDTSKLDSLFLDTLREVWNWRG
jgi:predicted nucleotidyltransferase